MAATEALLYSYLLLIRATAVQPRLCHRLLALLGDAQSACDHFVASEHGSKCGLKYPVALRLQERLRAPALHQQVEMDLAWLARRAAVLRRLGVAGLPAAAAAN